MRRAPAILIVFMSCTRHDSAATQDAGTVAETSRATSVSTADVDASASSPDRVVQAWNDAHTKRDAQALASVYADTVNFYGTKLTNAECVEKKAAAFRAAPDFMQSIGTVSFETVDGLVTARFEKITSSKGISKTYPAVLVISSGHVVEENDVKLSDNWCLDPKDFTPTKRVVAPFTVSAADAVESVMSSNHFAALRKAHPSAGIDLTNGFSCARRCAKPDRECGFQMRASDFAATSESNLLEWFAVDPMTKVVWFQDFDVDGGPWKSEARH